MRTAMVGKDKIWSGDVNRHLAREKKNLNFGEIEREEAPPTERAEWNEFIRMYLDGVKNIIKYYWNELGTIVFWYYLKE